LATLKLDLAGALLAGDDERYANLARQAMAVVSIVASNAGAQRRYSDRQLSNRLTDMAAELDLRRRLALASPNDRNLIYGQSELDRMQASVRPGDTETMAKIDRMREALPELNRIERLSGLFDEVGDAFGNMAGSMCDDIRNVGEAVDQLSKDLMRLVIRQTVTQPIADWISGGLKGLSFGSNSGSGQGDTGWIDASAAEIRHGGGQIGTDGVRQWVPSGLFNDAPRLHGGSGLAPDERAVIMKKGEYAFQEDKVTRALPIASPQASSPKVTVNVTNQTSGSVQVDASDVSYDRATHSLVINAVIKEMEQNTGFKNYIRAAVRGPI
jgi:hypothetical protein